MSFFKFFQFIIFIVTQLYYYSGSLWSSVFVQTDEIKFLVSIYIYIYIYIKIIVLNISVKLCCIFFKFWWEVIKKFSRDY